MEKKLMEILERIGTVYDLTDPVPANGKNLDCLAAARQELRDIHKTLSDILAEEKRNGG